MWNSRTVFLSPYTSPPPQPASTHSHTWRCWVYCGPGIALLAESAERGKEKQRGEEQKKKINSHRHATLHQVCYCPERETGGMEGGMERLFYRSRETFQRQRKTGDWKRRDVGERRVMIERIDLFDRCREIERDGATRGRWKGDCDRDGGSN